MRHPETCGGGLAQLSKKWFGQPGNKKGARKPLFRRKKK
jgi:hypothetical protein